MYDNFFDVFFFVIILPVNVKVSNDKSSKESSKPSVGKLKYSDNNVRNESKMEWLSIKYFKKMQIISNF